PPGMGLGSGAGLGLGWGRSSRGPGSFPGGGMRPGRERAARGGAARLGHTGGQSDFARSVPHVVAGVGVGSPGLLAALLPALFFGGPDGLGDEPVVGATAVVPCLEDLSWGEDVLGCPEAPAGVAEVAGVF